MVNVAPSTFPLCSCHHKQLLDIEEDTTMSTIANDALPRTRTSRRWIWWTVGTLGVLLVVAGIWFALMLRRMADENTPPPNLDVSRSQMADENTPPPDL